MHHVLLLVTALARFLDDGTTDDVTIRETTIRETT